MRISDWSSDVCSSDLGKPGLDNGGDDGAAAAAGQDPAVQKALTYQPSPEVERRTRQELFDSIVVRIADPATKEKVEQTVTSDARWLQFHQVLTKAGYSTDRKSTRLNSSP